MVTKVKIGVGLEWELMLHDEHGFLLGVHFGRDRKIRRAEMAILKSALADAAVKLDALKVAAHQGKHNP